MYISVLSVYSVCECTSVLCMCVVYVRTCVVYVL